MFPYIVTTAFLFFSKGDAKLPNIGNCTYMEYFCNRRSCEGDFIKMLRKDPNAECSAVFQSTAFPCVKSIMQNCLESKFNDEFLDGVSAQVMCPSEAPTLPPDLESTMPCLTSLSYAVRNCMKPYLEKFAANRVDPSLCRDYARAKQCARNQIRTSNCSLLAMDQRLINLPLSVYNPYCGNDRDPGATGIDPCSGVRQLKEENNSTAIPVTNSTPSCSTQPWLFKCIVSFFSIVKIMKTS